jgi:transposase
MLPQELCDVTGVTCWRCLRDWQPAGVWELIHFALLDWLARHDEIDWSRRLWIVAPCEPCVVEA